MYVSKPNGMSRELTFITIYKFNTTVYVLITITNTRCLQLRKPLLDPTRQIATEQYEVTVVFIL